MRCKSETHMRLLGLMLGILAVAAPTLGQGRIYIEPPMPRPRPGPVRDTTLETKYQRIYAEITDGVAVTTIKQTFHNPLGQQVEGTYVFPLPAEAAVGDFSMTVNGKTMHGEVLDVEQARQTYENIVRKARDPGLLEYLGSRLYKARVFPIPPQGDVEVQLAYSQTLTESGGLGLFQHPLRAKLPEGRSIGELVVHARIHSQLPLTSVFCPSHTCEIKQPNDHEASVTYEATNVRPDRDFQMYYQRKDSQFGLVLLTHREAGEDGYFMVRLSPRIEIDADEILPKDIAFVIDTSGSMSGEKIEQVKQALKLCVNNLNPRDRFNLLTFSTEVRPFRDGLVAGDKDIREAALAYVDKIKAVGGTNINEALQAALAADPKDNERPYLIVFMTDGLPTVGTTDIGNILENVRQKNDARVRMHVLGVGSDVNTHLLDKLADESRGTHDYCVEGENLELKLGMFVGKLADPLLSDLKLEFAGLDVSDVYPRELSDLFRGTDVVVLGRYSGTGQHAVKLSGDARNERQTLVYEGDFPKNNPEHDFLPRLWATRKVGYLLDEIRLHGENDELVQEVKRLAKMFGIVTPYTAALVVEDSPVAFAPLMRRSGRGPNNGPGVMYSLGPRDEKLAARTNINIEEPSLSAESEMRDSETRWRQVAPDPPMTFGGRGITMAETLDSGVVSGKAAVEASRLLAGLKKDGTLDASYGVPMTPDGKAIIRNVDKKTFVFDGERWLDTAWDGKQETTKIEAFSDEYFELIRKHKEFAKYLTLGKHVVIVTDDAVYEIEPPSDEAEE
ncbi:MAG: VWA domain-containing protein [Phycisphaerae bacterium]|nr:VWA domain-containing protein [Phycisphaerae bacterium]